MRLKRALRVVRKLYGNRQRRSHLGRTRAHIEVRSLAEDEAVAFIKAVRAGFAELPRVRWVQSCRELNRLVVGFEEDAYTLEELVRVVEIAEQSTRVHDAPFRDEAWEHPGDDETIERLVLGIAADAIGLATGVALRFSPLPASRVAGTLASALSIVQTSPRLRRSIDEKLGPNRADLAMHTGASLAYGLSQRPGSALVELAHKAAHLGAAQARRRVWESREPELFNSPQPDRAAHQRVEPRPRPLPRGPIEEYADRAWVVSLGGFAVSLITTRSVQRAVAALFGGLPKPARLGRDAFTAHLERQLADRGLLVVDREALRRLDRIDCVVLEGSLVARDRFEVQKVLCDPEIDDAEALRLVHELFDATRPLGKHEASGYVLEPLGRCPIAKSSELFARSHELGQRGGLVLALSRAGRVLALAEVEWIAQTGIEELVAAAHEAQMRVVIASNDESVLEGLAADDTISDSEGIVRGVRRLQREGLGVCVIATGGNPGLTVADCSIGLSHEGKPPPWGAHVICQSDLSDARFLIVASVAARQVAKQSVNVALGAATLGALVSAGGVLPLTSRRVIAVVNAASLVSMANGMRGGVGLSRKALPPPRDRTPWYALDPRGTLHKLATAETGLTRREAASRRRTVKTRGAAIELVESVTDELFNPLAPLLAAGAGLSAAVGSFGDASMVGGVVLLNALIGGFTRFRTERAVRDLGKSSRRRALVRRSGELYEIDAGELSQGDIVLLRMGDVVPADCRILESEALEVDSSTLTGESLPVRKTAEASFEADAADRSSMLYDGTVLAAGRATAVVVAVGDDTEARRGGVAQKRDASRGGVERRLRSLIDLTGPVALGAGVGLIGAGLLRGRKLEDLVGSGVSLAVAAVPEGLPLLATAAQLAAARRLSKAGALVRNVRSIEALGRVDVICLDKTGTLTEGRIQFGGLSDGREFVRAPAPNAPELAILSAALRASGAGGVAADPTDSALARAAIERGLAAESGAAGWIKTGELPYEAGRGYHATLGENGGERVLTVKGAPELVLRFATDWQRGGERVPLDLATVAMLNQHASDLGRLGYRLLAVGERRVSKEGTAPELGAPHDLVFLGFVGFRDGVRSASARAVADLATTGIQSVMVTGDHASTARAIAEEVGLLRGRAIMTGSELADLNDDELDRRIESIGVFARVTPPQKVRVVRALQRRGRVVAMVGDGANDAPAIRLANVGIAIGERSTAAAQAAADIVLTDARIEVLAQTVWEGRAMWASVRDAVSILVGGNLGEIGFTLGAGLIDGRPPLSARQLLLVNLLTDVAPAMAIALRPPSLDSLLQLASEGPERSLGQPLSRDIVARAAVTALGASSAWAIGRLLSGRERAGTVGLVALVGTQLGQTLLSGRFSQSVVATSIVSSAALAAIVQTPGVSHAFGCRPLGPLGWSTAIGASTAATLAAKYFPGVVDEAMRRLRFDRPLFIEDPEAPPALVAP